MTLPAHPKALERVSCAGVTKEGKPCRSTSVRENGYCMGHQPQEVKQSHRFGGPQPGSGRPRIPKPSEVAMELVEERALELVEKTIDRALHAERALVSQSKGIIGYEPDHAIQQRSTEFLLQYRWGKPTQRTEVTGAGGGPVSIAHLVLSLNDVDSE